MDYDAVVLAGGSSSRMGGADKAEIEIHGERLLDRVVEAVRDAKRVIVVGPRRDLDRAVLWARETPPGGGPAAALAAGLVAVRADVVVVLAVDLPFVTSAVVHRLLDGARQGDGAIAVDARGVDQPLAAAYDARSLRAAFRRLPAVHGQSIRQLIKDMDLSRVRDELVGHDCDTWEDVESARAIGLEEADHAR